jgi:hypothetical protein
MKITTKLMNGQKMKWIDNGFKRKVLVANDGEVIQEIVKDFATHFWTVSSDLKEYFSEEYAKKHAESLVKNKN